MNLLPHKDFMAKKVIYIARHCWIRVVKEALCIKEKGYDLHLITERVSQFTDWAFKTITVYPSLNHLYDSIKMFPDADLFHVHNEPSFFVTTVKETFPNKPVILDVHDTMLSRRTKSEDLNSRKFRISVDERNNFRLADGLVYVCDPHQKKQERPESAIAFEREARVQVQQSQAVDQQGIELKFKPQNSKIKHSYRLKTLQLQVNGIDVSEYILVSSGKRVHKDSKQKLKWHNS